MATRFMGHPAFKVYFGQTRFKPRFRKYFGYQTTFLGRPAFMHGFSETQLCGPGFVVNSSFVLKIMNFTFLVEIFFHGCTGRIVCFECIRNMMYMIKSQKADITRKIAFWATKIAPVIML